MENEKLENQKIDESELENVAGGYDVYKLPFSSKPTGIVLNKKEFDMLDDANYIIYSKNGTRHINKSDYEKALKILDKAGTATVDNSHDDDNQGCSNEFIFIK